MVITVGVTSTVFERVRKAVSGDNNTELFDFVDVAGVAQATGGSGSVEEVLETAMSESVEVVLDTTGLGGGVLVLDPSGSENVEIVLDMDGLGAVDVRYKIWGMASPFLTESPFFLSQYPSARVPFPQL
jgi:hypothetical protein